MKWLNRIWPWKRIHELEQRASRFQKDVLEHYSTIAQLKVEKQQLLSEVMAHQDRASQHSAQARKMAQIIALKGGIL